MKLYLNEVSQESPSFRSRDLTKEINLKYLHSLSDPVVQLVRAPACHAGSCEFESRPDRQEVHRRARALRFSHSTDDVDAGPARSTDPIVTPPIRVESTVTRTSTYAL